MDAHGLVGEYAQVSRPLRGGDAAGHLEALCCAYGALDGLALLRAMIEGEFPGRIALVSSFGAESAVLLDLVAQIDQATPVIFLDTGKLFPETLAYRDELVARFGLRDVRSVQPDPIELDRADPHGDLWRRDPERCCALRKVVPLERALFGFDAWITGRKRHHGGERRALETIEVDPAAPGRVKINPLARWSADQVGAYSRARNLPNHPLVASGYRSIGCEPCTAPVAAGDATRGGRWVGLAKTECGIHRAPWARG